MLILNTRNNKQKTSGVTALPLESWRETCSGNSSERRGAGEVIKMEEQGKRHVDFDSERLEKVEKAKCFPMGELERSLQ